MSKIEIVRRIVKMLRRGTYRDVRLVYSFACGLMGEENDL